MKKPLGLYIHIPFCVRKCEYCDFLSWSGLSRADRTAYAAALCREISAAAETFPKADVDTIFIGGGTPTTLSPEDLSMIMNHVRGTFHVLPEAEITMEMNPGTYSEGMIAFVKEHLTRVSIGLQSARNEELRRLGRIHTYEEFENCYRSLRNAGVDTINIDLMSALPGQSLQSWEYTLRKVIGLDPEHISAYSLIIEEGTPFYDLYESGKLDLPEEDEEREMYHLTKTILSAAGYERYEISNYAKSGFACRHNIRYWRREPYLGFGVGAASMYGELVPLAVNSAAMNCEQSGNAGNAGDSAFLFSDDVGNRCISRNNGDGENSFRSCCGMFSGQYRRTNDTDLSCYIRHYEPSKSGDGMAWDGKNATTCLSLKDAMEEFMFLGLRMTDGVSVREFYDAFGFSMDAIYGDVIRKYIGNGLLKRGDDRIALTERGLDVSNVVMEEFLL